MDIVPAYHGLVYVDAKTHEVMSDPAKIKAEILRLTAEFSRLTHGANRPGYEADGAAGGSRPGFVPGSTR